MIDGPMVAGRGVVGALIWAIRSFTPPAEAFRGPLYSQTVSSPMNGKETISQGVDW